MKAESRGLYVHIPFCKSKCNYCDFCSFSDLGEDKKNDYVNALISEISAYKREEKIKIDTLFFGGGTPSLLTPIQFENIIEAIFSTFDLASNLEFTVEVNPKTVPPDILDAFVLHGVNRISIGMQTIHENERKILGRIHNFDDFLATYQLVRKSKIKNINVDLMYAIPQQTTSSLKDTLMAICALSPEHISAYGLIVEPGTPFYENRDKLDLPSEDVEYEMYSLIKEVLFENGYSHYEISNYSKDGYECRHNLKYWHNEEYIGVGVNAHSYFEGCRFLNVDSIDEYICLAPLQAKRKKTTDEEYAYEYFMLGMRLAEGVSLKEYELLSGINLLKEKKEEIERYISLGYLTLTSDRLSFTESGFYVSNTILADLL